MWGFSCKACGKGFEAEWSPGASVTCPFCGTCFETDYDTDADDDIQGPWLSREVASPHKSGE